MYFILSGKKGFLLYVFPFKFGNLYVSEIVDSNLDTFVHLCFSIILYLLREAGVNLCPLSWMNISPADGRKIKTATETQSWLNFHFSRLKMAYLLNPAIL